MEKTQTANGPNMHAIILMVIGILLVIVGAAIITVPGAPMRGSGIGTILLLLGIVMVIIALLRFRAKRA